MRHTPRKPNRGIAPGWLVSEDVPEFDLATDGRGFPQMKGFAFL